MTIPPSSATASSQPAPAVLSFYEEHCIFLPAMLGWFFFSAALSTYNKFVFGEQHMHFPCPLLLTSFHFLMQWIWSYIVTEFCYPEAVAELKALPQRTLYTSALPCGLVTALDVGLSNLSLVFITMTFYTMVKSATPIFVLLWAYLLRIERITYPLLGVVLVITLGEFLTVVGETAFQLKGFLLCLSAAVLSGARWTLVQLKLRSLPIELTTIMTMRWLAPSMFGALLGISLAIEQPWNSLRHYTLDEWTRLVELGVLGGCLAVAMVLCEFYLILKSNAFMLMIGGVLKEMVTIVIGVTVFRDKLNWINSCGVFVVFLGVVCYKGIHLLDASNAASSSDARTNTAPVGGGDGLMKDNKSERGSLVSRVNGYTTVEHHDTDGGESDHHANDTLLQGSSDGWVELRKNATAPETSDSTTRLV